MQRAIGIMFAAIIVTACGVGAVWADTGYLDDIGIASWGWDAYDQVSGTPAGTDFDTLAGACLNKKGTDNVIFEDMQ